MATQIITLAPAVTAAAYSAGDSIGGKMTLSNAVALAGGAARLEHIQILDRANQKPQGTILIFNANPSAATVADKTAFVFSTDDLKVVAAIPVVTADWVTINSKAVASLNNLGRVVRSASGTTLYAGFVTTSTPTFVAVTDFQIIFKLFSLES